MKQITVTALIISLISLNPSFAASGTRLGMSPRSQHSTLNPQLSTPGSSIPPQRVKAEIKDILSSPEFRVASRPSLFLELQKRIASAFFYVINRLAEWLSHLHLDLRPNKLDNVLEWIVAVSAYILMAAGLGGLLYILIQVGRRRLAPSVEMTDDGRLTGIAEADVRTPEEALRLAAVRAGRGEFRDAFRAAYLAILLWLDARRMVEYAPSKTNWEYVSAAAGLSLPGVHEPLRTLSKDFDRKIYGGEECGLSDYQAALSAYESIASEAVRTEENDEDKP